MTPKFSLPEKEDPKDDGLEVESALWLSQPCSVINMRIMYPGASVPFAVKKLEPYWPPFKARP